MEHREMKKFANEDEVIEFIRNDINEMLTDQKAFIVTSFGNPGVKAIGHKISGRHYLRAAVALLKMAGESAPTKVQHHISQALCELRQIVHDFKKKQDRESDGERNDL